MGGLHWPLSSKLEAGVRACSGAWKPGFQIRHGPIRRPSRFLGFTPGGVGSSRLVSFSAPCPTISGLVPPILAPGHRTIIWHDSAPLRRRRRLYIPLRSMQALDDSPLCQKTHGSPWTPTPAGTWHRKSAKQHTMEYQDNAVSPPFDASPRSNRCPCPD